MVTYFVRLKYKPYGSGKKPKKMSLILQFLVVPSSIKDIENACELRLKQYGKNDIFMAITRCNSI